MLARHGFKTGEPLAPGGWCCYITDVIKSADYVGRWRANPRAPDALGEEESELLVVAQGAQGDAVLLREVADRPPLGHPVHPSCCLTLT